MMSIYTKELKPKLFRTVHDWLFDVIWRFLANDTRL